MAEQTASLVAQNYLPIAVMLGVVVCLVGLLRFLFSRTPSWIAAVIIALGAVFTALPFIGEASLGQDGLSIITNFQENSEDLNQAIDANKRAISQLTRSLEAVEEFVSASGSTRDGPTLSTSEAIRARSTILRSVEEASRSLEDSEAASERINQRLRDSRSAIQRLE